MMKKTMAVLMAVALSAGVIPAGANGEGRLGKFRIRDPFVLVDGGRYYLYEAKPWFGGRGVFVRESADLLQWSERQPCMTLPDDFDCTATWAPEVHRFGGSYYLFVTLTQSTNVCPIKALSPEAEKRPDMLCPRGTWIFKASSPRGPFRPVKDGPVPSRELMTLDGTLYVEDGRPYMVYCHEWCQMGNGTIEYAPLTADFSSLVGTPRKLLDARSAMEGAQQITDGVFFHRSEKSGRLYMIWSNHVTGCGYTVMIRRSESGTIAGPWTTDRLLFRKDGGHAMIFKDLTGRLLLTLHSPEKDELERMHLYLLQDDGEWLSVVKEVGAPANRETVDLKPIPMPVAFASDMDRPVAFDATSAVTVDCPDASAVKWLASHFAEWYPESVPRVVAGSAGLALRDGEEAYAVKADAAGIRIAARTLAGVRWAAYVLRQVAIARRGTLKMAGRLLPTLEVSDSPLLGFRCIHLVWLPEMRPQQIERSIRLAALFRFNHAIIEPWGVYRSEKHPWRGWPNGPLTKAEVRRLVALAKDLGVTLIPQINVFGHATSARSCTLKNAILDLHPEYEPLFEPGGWNWCLTNPETQRVLREAIAEMHEDFGNPPYFHLGCDEAQPPSCPDCRRVPYGDLVCRHIADLASFVARRGARAMIWHDMLLEQGDARWKGFVACGSAETSRLADLLTKDVVICDWEYSGGDPEKPTKEWPTMAYFKEKGFSVAGCPWLNGGVVKPMAEYLVRIGGFGYIQTTWHHVYGDDWKKLYRTGASAAWGSSEIVWGAPQFDTVFANALRLVGSDMKVKDPLDTGIYNHQLPPSWWIDN